MVAVLSKESAKSRQSEGFEDQKENANREKELLQRKQMIDRNWQQYAAVVRQTNAGYAGTFGLAGTEAWVRKTKLTEDRNDKDNLISREEFFAKQGKEIIETGIPLQRHFESELMRAGSAMSEASKQRWKARFADPKIGFQPKKYWVESQFKYYIDRAIDVKKKQEVLKKNPKLAMIDPAMCNVSKIYDDKAFLQLHYKERVHLVDKANAALLAIESGRGDLYMRAKSMLHQAAVRRVLARHKVGTWLERIFKSNASRKKIESFLSLNGDSTCLGVLIGKWEEVKNRYDRVMGKINARGRNAVRGWQPVDEAQFLDMHYTQRLRYVEECERRFTDRDADLDNKGKSDKEKEISGIFLHIRHALDIQDWEEADEQIAKVSGMDLSPERRERLGSMKRYLTQFRSDNRTDSKKKPSENAIEAKKKIDAILPLLDISMRSLVYKGLQSVDPNRYMHQLRWILYNQPWCTKNGYLTPEKQRKGASKENQERTKRAGETGGDTGRHDVLNRKTAGQQFIRNEKYARNKATYRHVDIADGAAMHTLGVWLEKEQHPKTLYWTTLCFNEGGEPRSENWHSENTMMLGVLRSATRTLQNAGLRYDSTALKGVSNN